MSPPRHRNDPTSRSPRATMRNTNTTATASSSSSSSASHHHSHHNHTAATNNNNSNNNSNHHHHPKLAILQSPDVRTFFESTANQRGVTNAATETGIAQSIVITTNSSNNSNTGTHHNKYHHHSPGMANVPTFVATNASSTTETTPTYGGTAMMDSYGNIRHHPPPQVHTIQNNPTKQGMTSPMRPTMGTTTTTTTITTNTGPGHTGGSSTSRKPVTTAINTVPYANCNARLLLQGGASTTRMVPSKGDGNTNTTTNTTTTTSSSTSTNQTNMKHHTDH